MLSGVHDGHEYEEVIYEEVQSVIELVIEMRTHFELGILNPRGGMMGALVSVLLVSCFYTSPTYHRRLLWCDLASFRIFYIDNY